MKTNKIILFIIYVIMLGGVIYLLFGPPHYWESISPNTEKKANSLVDDYLDSYSTSEERDFLVRIAFYEHYPGTPGYNLNEISNELLLSIDPNHHKATFNIETKCSKSGSNDDLESFDTNIELEIINDQLQIIRTTENGVTTERYDSKYAEAFDHLLFDSSIDFCKSKTIDFNRYRDDDNTVHYAVKRDINVEDKFAGIIDIFDIDDYSTYIPIWLSVSLKNNEPHEFSARFNGTDKQSYFVEVLDFLIGGFPFKTEKYEMNFTLFSK